MPHTLSYLLYPASAPGRVLRTYVPGSSDSQENAKDRCQPLPAVLNHGQLRGCPAGRGGRGLLAREEDSQWPPCRFCIRGWMGRMPGSLQGEDAKTQGFVFSQRPWQVLRPVSQRFPVAAFALGARGGGGSCNLRGGSFIVAWASPIAS